MIEILVKCDTKEQCFKELNKLGLLLKRQNINYSSQSHGPILEVNNQIVVEYVCDQRPYLYADLAIGFNDVEASKIIHGSFVKPIVTPYEHPYPYILELLGVVDEEPFLSFCFVYDLICEFQIEESLATSITVKKIYNGFVRYKYCILIDNCTRLSMQGNKKLALDGIIHKIYNNMEFVRRIH